MARILRPLDVHAFCSAVLLLSLLACAGVAEEPRASIQLTAVEITDGVSIRANEREVARYVYRDPQILRPYLANLIAPGGTLVTRHHPPVAGRDDSDHATMHPGIWLAFGDINGEDFWRNRARIIHERFLQPVGVAENVVRIRTESTLRGGNDASIGQMTTEIRFMALPTTYLVGWDATLVAGKDGLTLGDQEEMGLGVRMATSLSERAGGELRSSTGRRTAAETWGQAAAWCDYAGQAGSGRAGVTLFASPENFRPSWWHNRDYGLAVANPFGRLAMKQGERSEVRIEPGESLRLVFYAALHDDVNYRPEDVYEQISSMTRP